MSARRSRRSTKTMDKEDVNLSVVIDSLEDVDTPRKTSRARNSLLTSTPDKRESTEMERRSSSARRVKDRQSRQFNDDFNDGNNNMETGEQSIHSKSLILNHNTSMFDDKPKHLYGLDNPGDLSSDKEFEQKSKTDENILIKPVIKSLYKYFSMILFTCLGFCILAALMGIINEIHHHKDEHAAEVKLLKNRISRLEQMQSNQGIKSTSAQDNTYRKVFLRDQTVQCDVQQSEELIEQALQRWDADKIGIPDYALETSGGQIHSSYHSATFANGAPHVLLFGVPLWSDVKTPRVVIQPGNSPGECWAFQGSAGFVVIKLSQMIKPSSFTLEHMAASLSQFGDQSIPSAPKEFSVWGWSDAQGNEKTLLGEYVYDHKGYALQSFPVQASTVPEFRFIELRVHSNYGNPSYTCLYRFRVHGSPHRSNN